MIARLATRTLLAAALAASLSLTGCASSETEHHHHASAWANMTQAVAVIMPTKGNATGGVVKFTQVGDEVKIVGSVTGLTPGPHACHIHEFGDASSGDGMSTGGHYNPDGHAHGPLDAAVRHAGDLGNIIADAAGTANIDLTVKGISVAGLRNPIVGRALIVHAKADDFSQPVGNANGRVAVGIIGLAKPPTPATAPAK